ncbi:MAG: hypothetical protein IKX22_06880 [Prevotella sp.]|nr:hypothetical protein [Prevotella sp.]
MQGFIRFIISLIWLIISIGIDAFAITTRSYLVGAGAEFAFFLITFIIPYLRRKGSYTRYWGWLALFQGFFLLFLQFKNSSF